MRRQTVDFDDDVHRALKAIAEDENLTLSECVARALREYVEKLKSDPEFRKNASKEVIRRNKRHPG